MAHWAKGPHHSLYVVLSSVPRPSRRRDAGGGHRRRRGCPLRWQITRIPRGLHAVCHHWESPQRTGADRVEASGSGRPPTPLASPSEAFPSRTRRRQRQVLDTRSWLSRFQATFLYAPPVAMAQRSKLTSSTGNFLTVFGKTKNGSKS
jgi:hypothetical protein